MGLNHEQSVRPSGQFSAALGNKRVQCYQWVIYSSVRRGGHIRVENLPNSALVTTVRRLNQEVKFWKAESSTLGD
jgi:hypothetical protein